MSSLSDMAHLVTTDMGLFDDLSFTLAKVSISKNYLQIWDKYPWGDAQGYGYAQAAPGIAVVAYPAGMDRIITLLAKQTGAYTPPGISDLPIVEEPEVPAVITTDSWFLDPVDSTFLIESEPRIYDQRGTVRYYEDIGAQPGLAPGRYIRIYPIPIFGTTLFFFGKMICPGLSADTDQSLIRNIDPALIAYCYADMLQRQRQYGKADLKRKEALDLETNAWNLEKQQANQPRRTKATTIAGNSLLEMTDAVCQICGQWTPEYRQIIKEFLKRNYQSLYDMFLWPESLVMVQVPYTTEQVVLPEYIDKVIGVRGNNNLRMFPADAGLILDITPSAFDEIGEPISYTTLTPVGVDTLPATTTKLVVASTNPVDVSIMVLRGEVLSTGQQVEENIALNGTTPVASFWSYDIPLTVAKDVTFGFVTVNAQSDSRLLVQLLPYQRESKHQRLWFLPAPQQQATALILGKRAIRPLLIDQDTPIITGVQQVLIAAAAADMFRKLGNSDQATAFQQKAGAATDVLKAKNTDQAASAPRFVPQIEQRAYVAGAGGWNTW